MTFASILYDIIILPIESIIEFIFCFTLDKFSKFGVAGAIVAVSLAVNFLALPIYNVADEIQLKERELQKKMAKGIARIKQAFSGDERFMMLNTYYHQNNYHPLYALRQSLSILIEVPFFIAAYHFLSHCSLLENQSILFLKDLSKPDALISVMGGGINDSGFTLNQLPILMTAINVVSSIIYTKGAPLREKIQTFALAGIFLVLLYNSPSGLVFYWVLNQIFSLCKNIVNKMKHPGRIVYGFLCAILVVVSAYFILFKANKISVTKCCFYLFTLTFIALPFFVEKINNVSKKLSNVVENKYDFLLFIASCVSLVVLVGLCIPGAVIASSPSEFSFLQGDSSPFVLLWDSLIKALGVFLFWPLVIYNMFGAKLKKVLPFVFFCLIAIAILNFFVFPGNYGLISQVLSFYDKDKLAAGILESVVNFFLILLLVFSIFLLFFKKYHSVAVSLCFIVLFSISTVVVLQFRKIESGYENALYVKYGKTPSKVERKFSAGIDPIIKISRTGKNVFIIMLDRATGAYLQECFSEDKNLYEQYDGFTFYPNTVSFSYGTLAGSPPLYGGYEYIPAMINLRDKDTIVQKQQEAVSMLPRLFAQNDYSVLMTNMPYIGGYSEKLSDFYFMDKYEENIKSVYIGGRYADIWKVENFGKINGYQYASNTKLFPLYSIMKIMPIAFRKFLYNGGDYFTVQVKMKTKVDAGESYDITINHYSELDYLPEMTMFVNDGNTFSFLENEITHYPNVLQVPEYKPMENVTQLSESKYADDGHYYVNMAALKLLGQWCDYLKENDVYDNTRIIISADHGSYAITNLVEGYSSIPRGELTCLLLVKDFNSRGKLKIDDSFMTNADVPSIAVKDLIENPINPATGRDFTKFILKNPVYGEYTDWRDTTNHEGNVFTVHEGDWYSVKDSIFEKENWGKPTSEDVFNMTRQYVQIFDARTSK